MYLYWWGTPEWNHAVYNAAGRSVIQATGEAHQSRGFVKCDLLLAPTNGQVRHKTFFLGGSGRSPHMPGIYKNTSGPVGILLKKGTLGARQLTQLLRKG